MAHPEIMGVAQREKKEHLTPLMRAKAKAGAGVRINACPYGCNLKDLDDHGYCRHLIGFTLPGDETRYEPMVRADRRRRVKVEMVEDPSEGLDEDGRPMLMPKYPLVKETDKLVRATVCARVYRDVDGRGEKIRLAREAEERQNRLEERRELLRDLLEDPEVKRELLEHLSGPESVI